MNPRCPLGIQRMSLGNPYSCAVIVRRLLCESLMIFDASNLYNFLSGSSLLVGGDGSGDRFRLPTLLLRGRVALRLVVVSSS